MQLPAERRGEQGVRVGLFLLATGLAALEFFIPRLPLVPWLKPGLANAVTLVWLVRYGVADTLLFALLRIWLVSFYFGFSFVTVVVGTGGVLCAVPVMGLVGALGRRRRLFGLVGVSIAGAVGHNLGQLAAVYGVVLHNPVVFAQLPFMAVASVFFGALSGLLAWEVQRGLTLRRWGDLGERQGEPLERSTWWQRVLGVSLLGGCFGLAFVDSPWVVGACALGVSLVVQVVERGSVEALLFPLRRFWLLFVVSGAVELFFTYGRFIGPLPGVTVEGVERAALQSLRLWSWLMTSRLFFALQFHQPLLELLQRLFPAGGPTIEAALESLHRFPAALDRVRSNAGELLGLVFRPRRFVERLLELVVEAQAPV